MPSSKISVVRWVTVSVVVAFFLVLGWYLGQPGYTQTRLVFLTALGGLAVAGGVGVVRQRTYGKRTAEHRGHRIVNSSPIKIETDTYSSTATSSAFSAFEMALPE